MTEDPWDGLPEDHPSRGRNYEVGKCRPPKSGRFQPGEKGNRKGRRAGSKNLVTQLKDIFLQEIPVTSGGKTRKMPRFVAQMQVTSNKGLGGDTAANRVCIALLSALGLLPATEPDQSEAIDPREQAILDDFMRRMAPMIAAPVKLPPPNQIDQSDDNASA